jgi:Protein of unknown function (DUF3995)
MTFLVAAAIAAFLALAAGFHFYWGLGGKTGWHVAAPQLPNGQPLFIPGRAATLLVALALTGIAAGLLAFTFHVELLLGRQAQRWAMALLGAVFLARGLSWHPYVGMFKSVRHTAFGRNDTWFYSPGCVLSGCGFVWLAWQG